MLGNEYGRTLPFHMYILYSANNALMQVVITIFWLGKVTRGKFNGPELDLAAFSNLVDVSMTPLSRSEYSSPSGSTVFLPQEPPEPSEDGFFRYRGSGWGATPPWNQQGMASPARYDMVDRVGGYGQPVPVEVGPVSTANVPGPIVVDPYRPVRPQRPDTLRDASYPAPNAKARPVTATDTVVPATQRQVSAPLMASHGEFPPGAGVVRPTAATTADPLRYVKTETSPLAEEARLTMDQLQRQKQQNKQREAERDTDNWEAV